MRGLAPVRLGATSRSGCVCQRWTEFAVETFDVVAVSGEIFKDIAGNSEDTHRIVAEKSQGPAGAAETHIPDKP